jgi:hypothetical protein
MITTVKIVRAHVKALYWKSRKEQADRYMRKNLETLATMGSGKHETEAGFFTVTENNQYPADAIRSLLTTEEQALCMESVWSNARARVLFPAIVQCVKVSNGYKVSI